MALMGINKLPMIKRQIKRHLISSEFKKWMHQTTFIHDVVTYWPNDLCANGSFFCLKHLLQICRTILNFISKLYKNYKTEWATVNIKSSKISSKSIREKRKWVVLKEFRRFHSHDSQSLFQQTKKRGWEKRGRGRAGWVLRLSPIILSAQT